MDTNGDGIVDDLLAEKKRGRKSLGLTKEEMKIRREMQRRARVIKRREEKRKKDIERLVSEVKYLELNGKNKDEIVMSLFKDAQLAIGYNDNRTSISGIGGGRVKRYYVC